MIRQQIIILLSESLAGQFSNSDALATLSSRHTVLTQWKTFLLALQITAKPTKQFQA